MVMRLYFDMCSLKRPFDDQSQYRIRMETAAVLWLQDAAELEFIHTAAQDVENSLNPLPTRAAKVQEWLDLFACEPLLEEPLSHRTEYLIDAGFGNFDAFHLASAEMANADVFVTCDDRLISRAERTGIVGIRVLGPVELMREVSS